MKEITAYFNIIKRFSSWYKIKIFALINYFVDIHYKIRHLKETNFKLGMQHLYKNNLNDAILRFQLIDKFFAPNDQQTNYWLGWTYFLKNNYAKSLFHLQKSSEADQIKLASFLQNHDDLLEIPPQIWQEYRNIIAEYFTNYSFGINKMPLPYTFVTKAISNITKLPNNYNILELGSNIGLIGHEIKKRFPSNFILIGVENSERMNDLAKKYYVNNNIYDQMLGVSIPSFLQQNTSTFDVVLSCCSLSFTKNLLSYFNLIYSTINQLGYFIFCLPINKVTIFSLKRKEFVYSIEDIKEALGQTRFTILDIDQLNSTKNDRYCIIFCKKGNE